MENPTTASKKMSGTMITILVVVVILLAAWFIMMRKTPQVNDTNGQPVIEGITPAAITDEATAGFSQDDEISVIEKDLISTQTNLPD